MVNIRKNYLNGTPKTKTELYNEKKIIIIHNTATPGATTNHIKARQDGPDTTNKNVYTFKCGDRITFDRKLLSNGYEWISQPRAGGGFWYIPIRELKNSTYWVEFEKR